MLALFLLGDVMNISTVIYEDLKYYENPEFHNRLSDKLHRLLKLSCGVELDSFFDDSNLYFKYIYDSSSISRLVYHFNYHDKQCTAVIQTNDKVSTSIIFYFDVLVIPKSMPLGANSVKVIVNDELDFVLALFERRFNFGWQSNGNSQSVNRLMRSSIFIYKKKDTDQTITTSVEFFSGIHNKNVNLEKSYEDMKESLYFSNDVDFYKSFMNIMSYYEDHCNIFEAVFTDYPSHLEMAANRDNCIPTFLKKFEFDYRNSFSELKQRLLVLDMQLI